MPIAKTTPTRLDLEVYAGDLNRFEFALTADRDERITLDAGNDPVDLTGATIHSQCRRHPSHPDPGMEAQVEVVDAAAGRFDLLWDGEQVRALLAGNTSWRGFWDLQVMMPGKTLPTTVAGGRFLAVLDVTRGD